MIVKSGTFFGHPIILACDAKCNKAWGINNRPEVYVQDPEQKVYGLGFADGVPEDESIDLDDTADLADGELGEAPADPGVYEGGQGKPRTPEERLNKWCARECERCRIVKDEFPVEDFELPDYSKRYYNSAPHTRD